MVQNRGRGRSYRRGRATEGRSYLPTEVFVVHVADEQGLGGEGVRLDVHVGPGHLRTRN